LQRIWPTEVIFAVFLIANILHIKSLNHHITPLNHSIIAMSKQTEKIQELIELRAKARLGGGEKAIEK
jgi:hypothetical protein